jgi:hypothetical protein
MDGRGARHGADEVYTARTRRVYGGWEVTVAGVPDAKFILRVPTEHAIHERLASVLDRTDFRVKLIPAVPGG